MDDNLQAIRAKNIEIANEAEERLKRFPYENLGRAGQILVDHPRSTRQEQQRAPLRSIDGSGGDDRTYSQPPLMSGVGEGV